MIMVSFVFLNLVVLKDIVQYRYKYSIDSRYIV